MTSEEIKEKAQKYVNRFLYSEDDPVNIRVKDYTKGVTESIDIISREFEDKYKEVVSALRYINNLNISRNTRLNPEDDLWELAFKKIEIALKNLQN